MKDFYYDMKKAQLAKSINDLEVLLFGNNEYVPLKVRF